MSSFDILSSVLRQFRRSEMDVMRGCGGCDGSEKGVVVPATTVLRW
ncbi:hypothetical protein A2U01_0054101, partial [Trifolium medium]|nr:hypothetical protein [Trifolium medium]